MSHMTRPQASMNASSGELAKRKEGKHFGHESRASRRVRSNIGSALRQSLRSLRQSEVPSGLPSKRSALLSRLSSPLPTQPLPSSTTTRGLTQRVQYVDTVA
jgi:hypothetical protein